MTEKFGQDGSPDPVEQPTPAAELAIEILHRAFGRRSRRGSRERHLPRPARPRPEPGPEAGRESDAGGEPRGGRERAARREPLVGWEPVAGREPAAEIPAGNLTSAAELTIVLLPVPSVPSPRDGGRPRTRTSRPWTRPPGAGPP